MGYVLIVGATTAIGEAIAIEYAKLGYKLFLVGRDRPSLNRVKESVDRFYKPESKSIYRESELSFTACLGVDVMEYTTYYPPIPIRMNDLCRKARDTLLKLDIVINIVEFAGEDMYPDREQFDAAFKSIFYDSIDLISGTDPLSSSGSFITVFSISNRLKTSMAGNVAQAAWTTFVKDYAKRRKPEIFTMTIAPKFVDGDRVDLESEIKDIASMIIDCTLYYCVNGSVVDYIGCEKTVRP